MKIVYDEIWITTGREVKVCRYAIRKYEKEMRALEGRYRIDVEDLLKRIEDGFKPEGFEARWYELYLGLVRTRKRLVELQGFLEQSYK